MAKFQRVAYFLKYNLDTFIPDINTRFVYLVKELITVVRERKMRKESECLLNYLNKIQLTKKVCIKRILRF